MAIISDSVSPQKIVFNAQELEHVNFNGVNVWNKPTGETISLLAAGVTVRVLESSGYRNYHLVDKDYNGYILLVRADPAIQCKFGDNKDYASDCKYEGSNVDALCTAHYTALPTTTKSAVKKVSIPVRASAQENTQAYLDRHCFALSSTEWGFDGSSCEGEAVEYPSHRNKSYLHWTREVIGGMTNYAYAVNYNDKRASNSFSGNYYVHPAICVSKNQPIIVEAGTSVTYTLSV